MARVSKGGKKKRKKGSIAAERTVVASNRIHC